MMHNIIIKYRSLPKQVKASVWFLVCSFLQKGISVITTPIFTRILDTTEYGRYSVFNSWLGLATVFISMQLYGGVYSQGLIKFNHDRNVFSSSLQGLTLTLVLIWTVIYFIFHDFWNRLLSLTTVQMLAMLIMIWSSAVFNFWALEQRAQLKYINLVVITIMVSIAKPIIGVYLVIHAKDKVTARILGLAFVELISYFGLFILQMLRGRKFYSSFYWKYAIRLNLPLIPHYLSQTVLSSADRIMIGHMVGESEAGIYSLAYSISLIMTLFNTSLGQTIAPWTYQKIKEKKVNEIGPVVYTSFIIIAAVNIFLIALAPEIVTIFAPNKYYNAIWTIPPIVMSVFFMFAYDRFAVFEFYFEKTKFMMIASILAAALNLILNYIFINRYGYIAAGYTTLFCYFVYALAHYLFMKRICKKQIDNENVYEPKILIAIAAVFLIFGFLFTLLYKSLILRYLAIIVILIYVFLRRKEIMSKIQIILKIKK